MSRVLITGGAGFIGSRLALALRARGHEVTVLDNLSPQVHTLEPELSPLYRVLAGQVRFIRGDVTSRQTLKEALRDQQVVVHLAAETGTGQSMYQIERYCAVNVGGTASLLDLLANSPHAVERLVVASSRAIYGEGKYRCPEHGAVYPPPRAADDMSRGNFEVRHPGCSAPLAPLPTDEDAAIHPSSVYGITKQTQEQLVMTACPGLGVAPVALRYQNVYGPGQSVSNPYTGIISIFANLVMTGRPINIFEDGAESRDFVYVDDAVEATVLAIESPRAPGGIFNVGSGRQVTVLTVARSLARILGTTVPIEVTGNFRIGDIRHNYADLSRIEAALGFRPRYDFEAGVARLCAWVRSVEASASGYEASLAEMRAKGLLK